MAGRPSKLTPDLFDRLLEQVEKGAYVEVAAQAVGVHKTTLYDWAKQGQKDLEAGVESLYARVAEELPRRAAILEIELGHQWRKIAMGKEKTGNWLALSELLARQHPERWGKKIEVKNETTVTHEFAYTENASVLSRGAATRQFVEVELDGYRKLPEAVDTTEVGVPDGGATDSGPEGAPIS